MCMTRYDKFPLETMDDSHPGGGAYISAHMVAEGWHRIYR